MASRRSPSNGVRQISASFPTTLALLVGSYLLTNARPNSKPSPLCWSAEENQRVIEVGRNTFSRVPVLEFIVQLSHSSFLSKSGFHCSDDFLYSSTLKLSSPGTKHTAPVSPRKVTAVLPQTLQIRIARRELLVGPSRSAPTSCCQCSLCSVQSVPPRSGQHSFGLPVLGAGLASRPDNPLQRADAQVFSLQLPPMDVEDAEGLDSEPAGEDRTCGKERQGTFNNDIKERDGSEHSKDEQR